MATNFVGRAKVCETLEQFLSRTESAICKRERDAAAAAAAAAQAKKRQQLIDKRLANIQKQLDQYDVPIRARPGGYRLRVEAVGTELEQVEDLFIEWIHDTFDVVDMHLNGAIEIISDESPEEFYATLKACPSQQWLKCLRK